MRLRKLFWLAAEISLAALWVRFGSGAALALATAMLLLPLGSIPLNLYLRKKLRFSLTAETNLPKRAVGTVELELMNPTRLPVNPVLSLTVRNLLNGTLCREKLCFAGSHMTAQVKSDYCGRLRVTLEKAKLYDCFGLIGIPLECREVCHITVQPDGFETNITLSDSMGGLAESEMYSQYRPGSDMTETFQLREYVPGDSPRQIHWKLSGKLDRLIVRDPGLPIIQEVLLFWERRAPAETLRSIDAQAEVVVSIARAFLQQDVQFRLGWNDPEGNRCILHEIRDLDDLIAVLPRLLSAPGGNECHAGAELLTQTRPDALCSHMVYVAHTPAAAVLDWQGYGFLTVLASSDGGIEAIRFDETNYPTQLASLVL